MLKPKCVTLDKRPLKCPQQDMLTMDGTSCKCDLKPSHKSVNSTHVKLPNKVFITCIERNRVGIREEMGGSIDQNVRNCPVLCI